MVWQFLAQRILRHLPFGARRVPTVKTVTHEPPGDRVLAEVYLAHAAIHGPQTLLPQLALPPPPRGHERETSQAAAE